MSIEELNDLIEHGDINEFVRVCEARQRKALSKIADIITEKKGVRVILIAGASSAGKTTTAKRLCTQLRVNGLRRCTARRTTTSSATHATRAGRTASSTTRRSRRSTRRGSHRT